ncbi:TonB-dependent receptor [Maricaulis sp.]|uniref:TonB-dependent receptor n=1 Tax=unclassified Maricaulis TaxID=2632371 RepID=UPI001B22624F|nr:TonB-dependent receptor [Maricaulis sp.]MBO6796886.1 TonB-dependent receptor [Maricaulis sp.]
MYSGKQGKSLRHQLTTSISAFAIPLTSLALGAAAQAQDNTASQDVIVVTATRREETVQEVPLNIAAIGGEQIQEQGFNELADVLAFVPGINIVDRGGRQGNPIIVRGLNADPINSGDGNNDGGGTVATYLGEIPIFIDLKLNDLERVEVLLGPQGTLYGAGTLGGAIRFIPNRPNFDENMLEVRAETYRYSEADSFSTGFGFTFNRTLGDTFAVRGSLDYLDDSGFIDYPFAVSQIGVSDPDPDFSDPAARAANFSPIEDADSEEAFSGRLAARWAPNDIFDATLTYYFQFQDIGGRTVSSQRSTVPARPYEAGLRVPEPISRDNELLALEMTLDLGFAELTSATGYGTYEEDGQRDQTDLLISLEYSYETFPSFTAFTHEVGEDDFFNQEIRLVSTGDSRFSWIIGGYYNKSNVSGSSSEFVPNYVDYVNAAPFNFGLSNQPGGLEYFSTAYTQLTEQAFFGELGWDVTDRLTITVGARQYDYELQSVSTVDFPLFEAVPFERLSISEIRDLDFDPALFQADDGVLTKFNIAYDLTDNILAYFTVSEGYRIGGSNGLGPCPAFDPNATQGACALAPGQQYGPNPGDIAEFDERQYGPDQTTNNELGFKTTWLDGAFTFNSAFFFVEWEGPQVSSATVNANIPITVNAAGAESTGVELQAAWQVTPEFGLRGTFSRTKSELTEDVPFLIRTITPPGFATAFENGEAGDRLPGSPENQFSLFARYEQPLRSGNILNWNAGMSYQGDVLTRTGGRGSSVTLDSYTQVNTSVTYEAEDWNATFFINNVFDQYIETGIRGTPLSNQTVNGHNVRSHYANVAPPRTVGLRFSRRFGG